MLRQVAAFFLANVLSVLSGVQAWPEGLLDRTEFSGLLQSEIAYGTEAEDVHKAEIVLIPEIGVDLTPDVQLTIIGRLRGDAADDLEPGEPHRPNRSDLSRRLFVGDNIDVELREAYIDTEMGETFLRLGKQQVVWGQADGLKVLDVLNPRSLREFILGDFEDSRIPLWTINAEIPIGDAFLQLLWIPDRTYDDIPEAGATFAFTSPLIIPKAPPGVPVVISPLVRPDNFLEDSDVGVKLSAFMGGWDLSLNYAWHYFDRPVVRREITSAGVLVNQSYERTHLLGGAFSNVFSDVTLRGEIGLSSDRHFLTNNVGDMDGIIRTSEISWVLGLDYQGWDDWFVSTQIFQSTITDATPGVIRDKVDSTATFLAHRNFMNEALQIEALLIHSLNDSDGAVQVSLQYEWRSNVQLKIGADVFYGNSSGLFGQFDEKDRISMGIEVGF